MVMLEIQKDSVFKVSYPFHRNTYPYDVVDKRLITEESNWGSVCKLSSSYLMEAQILGKTV